MAGNGKGAGGGISRRDFLNGVLVASGAAIAGGLAPACTHIGSAAGARLASPTAGPCAGPLGVDPRALHGGNVPSTFLVAHWLRDRRLVFSRDTVTLAPASCDDASACTTDQMIGAPSSCEQHIALQNSATLVALIFQALACMQLLLLNSDCFADSCGLQPEASMWRKNAVS